MDRYLHGSINVTIRRMSSLKNKKIVITLLLSYSHDFFYFEIIYQSDRFRNRIPTCTIVNANYLVFFTFWDMAMYSICPSFFMFFFGCLTLKNVQKCRQLTQNNRRFRRTDIQLLRMLIGQVLIINYSIDFTLYNLSVLYIINTNNSVRYIWSCSRSFNSSNFKCYDIHCTFK